MSKKNRKRKLEGEDQLVVDGEQENIFPDEIISEMESMWEIPQIFHFLHLTKEALNIPHVSMYEMERMLLIPRASKQLANIMTSLLSSPITKAKLRKIPPMPYEFWTNILAHKIKSWFKVYEGKHRDAVKVLETIGVEPEFWNVFPGAPLLDGKDFEELNFKQRVWLLKTVCDTVMHARKTVQEEMSKQPWEDQFETVLGTDRYGARYIYFPQFIKSDLRIYRHCLDNKILSTVKPTKPKLKKKLQSQVKTQSSIARRKLKCKRRKSRWCDGLPVKTKKNVNNDEDKRSSDCKCSSDSAVGSLTNEDTNLSSTSNCSNNNHISLDIINRKRSRSLSKTSEASTTSFETPCRSTRSSGYDTNTSCDMLSENRTSQKMFKGFSNSNNGKCNIEIISGLLNGLKSELNDEKMTDDTDVSLTHNSQGNLELNATRQYVDVVEPRISTDESTERSVDNLSSSSKTDDEKLNEIIGAESSKFQDTKSEDNFHNAKVVQKMSTTSKSDDEKLSETRTTSECTKRRDVDLSETGNFSKWSNSPKIDLSSDQKNERKVEVPEYHECFSHEVKSEDLISNETNENEATNDNGRETVQTRRKAHNNNIIGTEARQSDKAHTSENSENNDMESNDGKISLGELRTLLQEEAMEEDFSFDEQSENGYNLRKPKDEKTDRWKQDVENFNEMLLQLSVSKFQLVADSVQSLRELIASFSKEGDNTNTSSKKQNEPMPISEVRLVRKLKELLASLEEMEPALRESTRKARGRLQKEWSNFKEGSVEDQDSSGEGGLSSNWWVLGSQGCPLPTSGDATLQTISQSAISPTGTTSIPDKTEVQPEEHLYRNTAQGEQGKQECREQQKQSTEDEARRRSENEEEERSQEGERDKNEGESKEEEQQTRRVLRARGVSSYTEQLYSDDEIEENELEEWTDVEAVYAAPGTQTSASAPHTPPKVRHADDWSNEEDSDQDWILPSSRKRKNKRPSANRRLKTFQQKLQNIKVDGVQDTVDHGVPNASLTKTTKEKPKIKETKVYRVKKPIILQAPNADNVMNRQTTMGMNDPNRTVLPTETICKVEAVDSVHSELDIKDEGPIFDTVQNQFENNYNTNLSQNYVMVKTDHNPMNYYVMQPGATGVVQHNTIVQPGPVISGIIPPLQPGYYVQGAQNYIIHNPQPSFVSPPQPNFQPQGPQMMAPQQFISHPGYVPYMVSPAQPQPGFMTAQIPREQFVTQDIRQPALLPNQVQRTPNRFTHNRPSAPRQNFPPLNGGVIRSNAPIRESYPRTPNVRATKNAVQQRASPSKVPRARKTSTPAENTGQKTTSLIVLSDSDDEIEMIITEKTSAESEGDKTKFTLRKNAVQQRQRPIVSPEAEVPTSKGVIPPQIIQRMNQGGISITPVKPTPAPVQNTNTQLVVVVNETGSHYALALPNGSKLILTPEQVAQIRASNGGKLIL